ncbi:TPA: hypothetical protein DCY43_03665 [candidate division WWE3 bacterium]|uniref:Chloroplast import component protein (Tic20) n=3 Tax=Katanobacteria TaxID=422282 RepID=A0A0G1MT69_UNCKA|nr:MAG: hypothetical protein UW65_C0012G0011 [candidate division WWE3 bacterium GW2011_GWB1_44_4]KKT83977.1 MAG: hypothetical protein UW82_C0029G0014 [candidate division WWE3 bacterium GW2011_GWC2_44_9]HAZ29808.1 hypothetical protein [candidate division WWE3 bacterium]
MQEDQSKKDWYEPNVLATLSYIIPGLMGLVMYFWLKESSLEKETKFIRFHAVQSIIFGIVWLGAWAIASNLRTVLVGFILSPLVNVVGVAVWVIVMWKAYSNEEYRLPFIGDIAHNQVYS